MAFKRNKMIKELKKWVSELDREFDVTHAYLFGSYAKGHPTKWSDIDVAVVSPNFKGIRFYDYRMLIPYLRKMPSALEVHPFKDKDFTVSNLFVREVKNGIKIK